MRVGRPPAKVAGVAWVWGLKEASFVGLYLWSGWSKSARCCYNVEEHILGVLFLVFSCFFVVCGVRGAPFQKAKIVKFWGQVRGHREGGRCCLSLGCT